MATYVTRPRAWVSATATPEGRPTCDVFEEEKSPIRTGILNADGAPIYRMPTIRPIGFDLT